MGWRPAEPFIYVNDSTPIRSHCLACGGPGDPTWNNIRTGKAGCGWCSRKRVDPAFVKRSFSQRGLEMLGDYVRSGDGILSRCNSCHQIVSPSWNSIREGSGCWYCAERNGAFKMSEPAFLYLITHPQLQAGKIGVCGLHSPRLHRWTNHGWVLLARRRFDAGREAVALEQEVLRVVHSGGRSCYLNQEDMGGLSGASETFSIDEIPNAQRILYRKP